MNYLNADEKKQVTYSDQYAFPPRLQTDIEKQIARVILVNSIPTKGKGDVAAKQEEIDICLAKLKELTVNNRLADKVKAALVTPEKFDEFTEGYPYAKYSDIINGYRKPSTLVQLGIDGFNEGDVNKLMRWVAQLAMVFHAGLPKGVDTFIWTPHTSHYKTHNMVKATGDKAFYGYTLPAQEQALVNTLFADMASDSRPGGSLWAMRHVRRLEIHKASEVWARLGWGDVAKEVFDKGLEINFGNDHVSPFLGGTGPYSFLELRHESTNTRLRFIVEG